MLFLGEKDQLKGNNVNEASYMPAKTSAERSGISIRMQISISLLPGSGGHGMSLPGYSISDPVAGVEPELVSHTSAVFDKCERTR